MYDSHNTGSHLCISSDCLQSTSMFQICPLLILSCWILNEHLRITQCFLTGDWNRTNNTDCIFTRNVGSRDLLVIFVSADNVYRQRVYELSTPVVVTGRIYVGFHHHILDMPSTSEHVPYRYQANCIFTIMWSSVLSGDRETDHHDGKAATKTHIPRENWLREGCCRYTIVCSSTLIRAGQLLHLTHRRWEDPSLSCMRYCHYWYPLGRENHSAGEASPWKKDH